MLSLFVDSSVNVVAEPTFDMAGADEVFQERINELIDLVDPDYEGEVDYIKSLLDTGGIIPHYYRDYIRDNFPPMYRVVIGGSSTSRRVPSCSSVNCGSTRSLVRRRAFFVARLISLRSEPSVASACSFSAVNR